MLQLGGVESPAIGLDFGATVVDHLVLFSVRIFHLVAAPKINAVLGVLVITFITRLRRLVPAWVFS